MTTRVRPAEETASSPPAGRETRPDQGLAVSERALGWLLLVAGLTGATAAFVLLLEKLALLRDSSYVPTCSINPVLNCGSVMRTEQAELFGFPNPIIGVATLPVVAATGAVLLAGARLARWYWLALQVGVLGGLAFIVWLFFQSVYRIGALCPYCMVVWAAVLPVAIQVTRRNLLAGVLGQRLARSSVVRTVCAWHQLALTVVVLAAASLVLERFWSYWSTLA